MICANFILFHDLAVDVMRSLVLNLIRSELEQHLLKDTSSDVVDESGLLERRDLAEDLGKVDWYSELCDGRVPCVSLTNNWQPQTLPVEGCRVSQICHLSSM